MKLRVTRADESKIKPAIFKYNLLTETPKRSLSSGACDWVNDGISIQGGYLIKHKRELVGWASAGLPWKRRRNQSYQKGKKRISRP
jgi:hypothetical protein